MMSVMLLVVCGCEGGLQVCASIGLGHERLWGREGRWDRTWAVQPKKNIIGRPGGSGDLETTMGSLQRFHLSRPFQGL